MKANQSLLSTLHLPNVTLLSSPSHRTPSFSNHEYGDATVRANEERGEAIEEVLRRSALQEITEGRRIRSDRTEEAERVLKE